MGAAHDRARQALSVFAREEALRESVEALARREQAAADYRAFGRRVGGNGGGSGEVLDPQSLKATLMLGGGGGGGSGGFASINGMDLASGEYVVVGGGGGGVGGGQAVGGGGSGEPPAITLKRMSMGVSEETILATLLGRANEQPGQVPKGRQVPAIPKSPEKRVRKYDLTGDG